jgi:hypothetical protein
MRSTGYKEEAYIAIVVASRVESEQQRSEIQVESQQIAESTR